MLFVSRISVRLTLYFPYCFLEISRGKNGLPQESFHAEKTAGIFFTASANVYADFSGAATATCGSGSQGYSFNVSFKDSQPLVTEKVNQLRVDLCYQETQDHKLLVVSKSYLLRGSHPGGVEQDIVEDVVRNQGKSLSLAVLQSYNDVYTGKWAGQISTILVDAAEHTGVSPSSQCLNPSPTQ